jgi:hypothetical protein
MYVNPIITKASLALAVLLLLVPLAVPAQTTNGLIWGTNAIDSTIFIRSYYGCSEPLADHGDITVPATITGLPVTEILLNAFQGHSSVCITNATIPEGIVILDGGTFFNSENLAKVTIAGSVTDVGPQAFANCVNLKGVYFAGNAPGVATNTFAGTTNVTVYYLPGTTGWGVTFGGVPTALWQPQIQVSSSTGGVDTNGSGFVVTWAVGSTVVVEACTNLSNRYWTAIQTNLLTSVSAYFSDEESKNSPGRFYRVRSR